MACLAVVFSPQELPPWIVWSVLGHRVRRGGGLTSLPVMVPSSCFRRIAGNSTDDVQALRAPRLSSRPRSCRSVVQVGNVAIVLVIGLALHWTAVVLSTLCSSHGLAPDAAARQRSTAWAVREAASRYA